MTIDLSAEGRLEVHPFVTERKVEFMSDLISDGNRGGFAAERAAVSLKEALASSDAAFSLAHLINLRNLPQYDVAERKGNLIAAVETVDDFKPASFYSLVPNFDNLKFGKGNKGQSGVAPKVSEFDTYQYAYGYTEESVKVAIEKRGIKFGVSLEQIINDPRRIIRKAPGDLLNIALNTEDFLIFSALQDGVTAASKIATGTAPFTGATVPANAPLSIDALRLGLAQIGQRKVNGNLVPLAAKYYLVVQSGQGEFAEAELEKARLIRQYQDGSVIYGAPSQGNLGRVAGVIESPWITTATAWYLVPAAGESVRPSLVRLELAGRTAPEVLVNNFTGTLVGGGNGSSPFDLAHFDNDTVDLKLRQFTNSGLLTQDQIVWSPGV